MHKELIGNLVAVYGSLRSGLGNHRVLGDSPYIDTVRIHGFDMYSYGSYPYVTTSDGEITVELYRVPDGDIAYGLDCLEGFPQFYDRKLVPTPHGQAWIYFIDNENNEHFPHVKHGDWKKYLGGAE